MDVEQFAFFQPLVNYFADELTVTVKRYIEILNKNDANALEMPLIVKLSIDYDKWSTTKDHHIILNTILNEPLKSQKDIQMTVWLTIGSLLAQTYPTLQVSTQYHQVHCIIRFTNLPLTAEFQFIPFRYPVRLSLSVMKCVLCSFSDQCLYVRQSVWFCPIFCSQNQNHIFDGETGKSPRKCFECGTNLVEYEDRRSTYSCRWIRVFNAECYETPIQYERIYRDVNVKLSDDLSTVQLLLGHIYILTGTYDIINQTFVAWNFHPFNDSNAD